MENPISQARLKELVHYDPETGVFTAAAKRRRGVIGMVLGHKRKGRGDITVYLDRRIYQLHRLAWLYVHGEFPPCGIDHINRDPSDNRLANLRLASLAENNRNVGIRSHNTSGFKGVVFAKNTGNWRARIAVGRTQIHLGHYSTPQEAAAAYEGAARVLHGKFFCEETRRQENLSASSITDHERTDSIAPSRSVSSDGP